MEITVSTADKKEFIRWFLKRYKLKRRECVWILNYLISHEGLLENIHFVEEAHYCPRAMIISTINSESIPFRFYKGNLMTADAEKSFHDLRLYPGEKMYIQLNFPNSYLCPQFALVLEKNPYFTENMEENRKDKEEAETFLNQVFHSTYRDILLQQIDETLDTGNKELFMELVKQLNEYEKGGG